MDGNDVEKKEGGLGEEELTWDTRDLARVNQLEAREKTQAAHASERGG